MNNPFIKLNVSGVGETFINGDKKIEFGAKSYEHSFGVKSDEKYHSWVMVHGDDSILSVEETPEEIISKLDCRL